MPFEVDTEAMEKAKILDIGKPPLRSIPHMEFPKCIYKHPKDKFKTVRVKDERGVVVEEYKEPTTHLTKIVNTKAELDKALKDGWVKEPYIPADLPDELYESVS